MKKLFTIITIILLQFVVLNAQQEDYQQTFIAYKSTGVQDFLTQYPEYDGRGTLILILDSGVDMGVDGLQKTSTGKTKVIEAQDFSHEGDTKFYEADIEEEDDTLYFMNEDMGYKVKGANKLSLKSVDDEYFIGTLPESKWLNSGSRTRDLNGNGKENDNFFYVTFKANVDGAEHWVVYIDTNSNGDLSDEKPLMNYDINYDTFTIKNDSELPEYTFALNIFPDKKEVIFHYDAVAHGTHCAGIAAGYRIGNNDFSGVAPGAFLGSLKIGGSIYTGGSTISGSMKAAYDYADKLARERKEPVIINMSYGIGSELEGRAEIEKYLEQLVSANPYLYISTSNGNEGPGISTTGLPAASSSILSSGAVLAKELAADLYGAPLDRDVILHFSSRGGEVAKPDVVSPGAATSTVPLWTRFDRFWGTSMASPYSAGVMSLLLSAMKAEYPDVKIPSRLLYNAIKESAVPMVGYTPIDQGGGLINVVNAYNLLKKYIDEGEIDKFETYTVSSFAPNMPDGRSQCLYIRNGEYLTGKEKFSFQVKRDFFNKHEKFYRTYNIKSEDDWLIPITKRTYLRNSQRTSVDIMFDKAKMSQPGLYSGRLKAYRADNTKFPEFEMLATVVIPYEFTWDNNFSHQWINKLAPAEVKRYFVNVPPGATAMKVNLSYDKGEYSETWLQIHNPDGKAFGYIGTLESERGEVSAERTYSIDRPGVYEIDAVGYYRATDSVEYKLNVQFLGMERVDDNLISESDKNIKVVNQYKDVTRYNLSGDILGYQKDYEINLDNQTEMKIPFTLYKNESERIFNFRISKEDFNKLTDFAIMILDDKGKAVSSDGFSYKECSISVNNSSEADSANYVLDLIPGFAIKPEKMTIFTNEVTNFQNSTDIKVANKGNSHLTLYPSITETIDLDYDFPAVIIPKDAKPYGKIYFKSPNTDEIEYKLPIYFNIQ